MNGLDVALIVVLIVFALRGYWRGFFRETFGVVALVAGVAAALQFAPVAALELEERASLPPVIQAGTAFVGIFVVVYLVVNVIGVVADRLAGGTRLWLVHQLAGAVVGVAKGGVVLAAVLLLLHLLPIIPTADTYIMGSAIARPLVGAASDVLRLGARDLQAGPPSRT